MAEPSVILISDDEDENELTLCANDSVFVVENNAVTSESTTASDSEVVDEDISITFSRKAVVMPHARYDCSSHPFSPSENDTSAPVEKNVAFCEQCFCYICDKLASECNVWGTLGYCHCNAHKDSSFWKDQRNKAILGYLHVFNFDLLEVDGDLRLAESHLLQYEKALALEFDEYLKGIRTNLLHGHPCDCFCHYPTSNNSVCKKCSSRHMEVIFYNYSRVFECVSVFLDKAEKEKPRTAAVMLLGAARSIIGHVQPPGLAYHNDPKSSIVEAVPLLLIRMTNSLRTMMVACDFGTAFLKKLQNFFRSLKLPAKCRWLSDSLNVLQWDDPLLVAVLRGQNIIGERHIRGKKEVLYEPIIVIQMRVEKLKDQNKYRELARYLKVVRSNEKIHLQNMRDQIPFYLCKAGEYCTALNSFFTQTQEICCTACRLTPNQFTVYLKILISNQMPTGSDPFISVLWEFAKDGKPQKKCDVIRNALRIMNYNISVFLDPECWVTLIKVACCRLVANDGSLCCGAIQVPDMEFQQSCMQKRARNITSTLLLDMTKSFDRQIQIPKSFLHPYRDQSLLMLVAQALVQRLFRNSITCVLGIVMAFKDNPWALKWFYQSLSYEPRALEVFLNRFLEDLVRGKDSLPSRKWEPVDYAFIGDFIFFYLVEPRAMFSKVTHHTMDMLLRHWNESEFQWQYYLRFFMLQNSHQLSPDLQAFLRVIKGKVS